MKRVATFLIIYAILVIASSIFWVWYAISNSSLTAGNNIRNVKSATDVDKNKHDAELINELSTELIGGDMNGTKAAG